MEIKAKLSRILELFIFFSLFLIVVLAPLKFSLPFIEGISRLYPQNLIEWIFFSWPKELGEIFIIITCAIFLIKTVLKGAVRIRQTPFDFYHLGFIIILSISVFFSINQYRSIPCLIHILCSIFLFYLIIYNMDSTGLWTHIFMAVAISSTLISLYGLYQHFYGLAETRNWFFEHHIEGVQLSTALRQRLAGNRIFSTFVYPNALAGYLVLVLPFLVGIFFLKPASLKYRIIAYSIVISFFIMAVFLFISEKMNLTLVGFFLVLGFPLLNVIALALTFSKGGFFTLFLLFSFFVYFYFKKGKFKRYKTIIFGLYFTIILFFAYLLFRGDLGTEITSRLKAPTLQARLSYWKAGLQMVKEYPYKGGGLNTFGILYTQYKVPQAENTQLAHNNYLQIGAETGIMGLVLFSLIWIISSKNIFHYFSRNFFTLFKEKTDEERNQKVLALCSAFAVLAFTIHGIIDFDLYIPSLSMYGWLCLGVFVKQTVTFKELKVFYIDGKIKKLLAVIIIAGSCVFSLNFIQKNLLAEYTFEMGKKQWQNKLKLSAIRTIQEAIGLNKKAAHFHLYLSKLYAADKEYKQAIFYVKQAILRSKFTPYYHYYLAKLYYLLEKKEDKDYNDIIISELKKALAYNHSEARYHLSLAKYYEEKKEIEKSIIEYKQVLKFDSNNETVKEKIKSLNQM